MSERVSDAEKSSEGGRWTGRIRTYNELKVYRNAMEAAMSVFQLSKAFPAEERYSLVDQMRRSSRSVCANLGEAWRKRGYPAHFVSKLTDAASEAEETRVWVEFALRCGYLGEAKAREIDTTYNIILGQLVNMISKPEDWTLS